MKISNIPNSLIVLFVLILTSCKTIKPVAEGEADASLSVKKIVQRHYDNTLKYNYLRARVKIDYNDGENKQGFTVSLRMKKDEVIWLSATLDLVKAKITPEKVAFYNRIDNEYFEGDFSYLSELLGTELNFEKVQNLLVGNAVFDLNKEKYVAEVVGNRYRLRPKNAVELFKILLELEPTNYRTVVQQVSQPIEDRVLNVQYSYQQLNNGIFPEQLFITVLSEGEETKIDLEYKNLEFDEPMGFPYKIPKGFKKIVL